MNLHTISRATFAFAIVGCGLLAWEALTVDHDTWEEIMVVAIALQCLGLLIIFIWLRRQSQQQVSPRNQTNRAD